MQNIKTVLFTLLFFSLPLVAICQPELGGDRNETKSVTQARGIAATNTLMPIALGVGTVALFDNHKVQTIGAAITIYGLALGPSTGNLYADDYTRGMLGLLVRAAGGYLLQDATSEIFGRKFADALQVDTRDVYIDDTKVIIGGSLVLGSLVYNFVTAKNSVDEFNAARGSRIKVTVEKPQGPFSNRYVPVLGASIPF